MIRSLRYIGVRLTNNHGNSYSFAHPPSPQDPVGSVERNLFLRYLEDVPSYHLQPFGVSVMQNLHLEVVCMRWVSWVGGGGGEWGKKAME